MVSSVIEIQFFWEDDKSEGSVEFIYIYLSIHSMDLAINFFIARAEPSLVYHGPSIPIRSIS